MEEAEQRRQEEVEVAMAIFGDEVAVEGWEDEGSQQKFRLTFDLVSSVSSCKLRIVFLLGESYPLVKPDCELIATGVDRKEHAALNETLRKSVDETAGSECMAEVMQRMKEAHDEYHEQEISSTNYTPPPPRPTPSSSSSSHRVCVLKVDHMREERRYTRTISGWILELGLQGKLFMWKRLIYLVVRGDEDRVSRYLHLHRTQQVDVDSRGRRCKERMLQVIHDGKVEEATALTASFEVIRCQTSARLAQELE
ncbi:hypothetical protein GUITHDRAFT_164010, partial [Guillardia theta CCMP2712]